MANHETRPGSWGKIPPAKRQPDGSYKANGRYKTLDGKLLQRFRTGTTARKAEDALLAAFQTMAAEDAARHSAELDRAPGREPEVLFAEVVESWISYIEAGGKSLRVSTAYEYARMARADIVPSLGALKLTDVHQNLRRFSAWHRERRPLLCKSRT